MKSNVKRMAMLLAGTAVWMGAAAAQEVVELDEVTIHAAEDGAVIR